MKKAIILTSVLALSACGTAYHSGKIGMKISESDIDIIPQEAKVSINTNNKLSGSAKCSSFLWIFKNVPHRQTYGYKLQTHDGVMASGDCVAAAVYDAMKDSDADIIVAPQYTTAKDGFLCFGQRCFIGTTKVLVKGYAGKITSINEKRQNVSNEKTKK